MLNWLGVSEPEARSLQAKLLENYRQPGRAYHTLGHALRVLRDAKIAAHRYGADDYGAVQLAALLHDVIYDTRSRDNEVQSADFVISWGQTLGITPATYRNAAEIVRATQSHDPAGQPDAKLVLDADLAILAAPWDVYDAYRRAIRREYGWVTETDWTSGRRRVLSGFLERKQIYSLPVPGEMQETAARANITRELSLL